MTHNFTAWARYYYRMGFNPIPTGNKGDVKAPKVKWQDYMNSRPSLNESLFQACRGIGAVAGVNDIRCLDFDKVIDPAFVEDFLANLGLQTDNGWLVRSGNGYHQWVKCSGQLWLDRPWLQKTKKGKDRTHWTFHTEDKRVDHFEIRWNNFTVLPPTLHPNGKPYTFPTIPNGTPPEITVQKIEQTVLFFGRKKDLDKPEEDLPQGPSGKVGRSPSYPSGQNLMTKLQHEFEADRHNLMHRLAQDKAPGGHKVTDEGKEFRYGERGAGYGTIMIDKKTPVWNHPQESFEGGGWADLVAHLLVPGLKGSHRYNNSLSEHVRAVEKAACTWLGWNWEAEKAKERKPIAPQPVEVPEKAEEHPLILRFGDEREALETLYRDKIPEIPGLGFEPFDAYQKLTEGMLIELTGVPGSAKTGFANFISCLSAVTQGRKWVVFSGESFMPPTIQGAKMPLLGFMATQIASTVIGKACPILQEHIGVDGFMSEMEFKAALSWMNEHFVMVKPFKDQGDDQNLGLEDIKSVAKWAKNKYGTEGLIIDPYNGLREDRLAREERDIYTARVLQSLRNFNLKTGYTTLLVAHPTKIGRTKVKTRQGKEVECYEIVYPERIKGGSGHGEKADKVWSLRDVDGETEIHYLKSKHNVFGVYGTGFCKKDIDFQVGLDGKRVQLANMRFFPSWGRPDKSCWIDIDYWYKQWYVNPEQKLPF